MRLRLLAFASCLLAAAGLLVNVAGAISQEREGGRDRGFPDWLYSLSGYAFIVFGTVSLLLGLVLLVRRITTYQ